MINFLSLTSDFNDSLENLSENYGPLLQLDPDGYSIAKLRKLKWITIKKEMEQLREALKNKNENEMISILENYRLKNNNKHHILIERLFGVNQIKLNHYLKSSGTLLEYFAKFKMWNLIDYLNRTTTLGKLKGKDGKRWVERTIIYYEKRNQKKEIEEMLKSLESIGVLDQVKIQGMSVKKWMLKSGSDSLKQIVSECHEVDQKKHKNTIQDQKYEPTVGELLEMENAKKNKPVVVIVKKKRAMNLSWTGPDKE